MKHLKLYENQQQNIVILNATDIFDGWTFTSFQKPFFTKQDAENYMINHCNHEQDNILNSNEDEHIKKIGKIQIHTFKDCENFLYTCVELLGHDELETYISINENIINSVEIDKDVKLKLTSQKYNI